MQLDWVSVISDVVVRQLLMLLVDNAIFAQEEDVDMDGGLPETPSSRLTTRIISLILPLMPAKDKVIRFRSTQIVAHLINTLDSVDDELFQPIRIGLLRRLRDKEITVRTQAVYGLGRLAGETDANDDDEDSDDDSPAGGVLAKLLDVLQNDPSADVRRSLLLNLPFTPATLPYLLERARDSDAAIRRALYSRLLPALGDFRHLSLTHREKLLRWGLRDRDDTVRKATARLFRERWIENCAQPRNEDGEPIELPVGRIADPSLPGLLELLERIDIVNAGVEGGIALDAMKEFWAGRPDYCDHVTFDETYWQDITAESAFVARTFNDFCRDDGAADSLREKMPEVTRFAFLVQQNINILVEAVRRMALQEDGEEDSVQQEFIVEQLLHIALTLDYSDEVGRRTMFSLMREALAIAELPEESTRLVAEVLRTACGTSAAAGREFSGVVLEAIAEVHDTIMGEEPSRAEDESFHSARSEISGESTPRAVPKQVSEGEEEEKAVREIMVNMKCLHIAQCMLQNVDCSLEQNAHLVTMLNNLVIPAVRSQEAPIRERGLLCLGLCCLLDKVSFTSKILLLSTDNLLEPR
jgi:condensin complex subunit 3